MCRHERRLLIQNVEHGWNSGFQILCASCLLTTERWPIPFYADQQWRKLVKLDALLEDLLASYPGQDQEG